MAASRHMSNASMITVECMTFRDCVSTVKKNGFLNLEIEGDSKVVIDSYNKIGTFLVLICW